MAKKRGQNEGSIFKRKDGRWAATISLGWHDGRRARKHFYGATAEAVREQLDRAKHDVRQGRPVAVEHQTVGEFLDSWLEESVKPEVRPLTFQQYHQHARLYLKPSLGKLKLAKLGPQHVLSFRNARLKDGLHPRTVELSLIVLRRALAQALKWNLVTMNAAQAVEFPKYERREVEPWTPEQARIFLEAAAGERLGALYAVALSLGLRRAEALGLRWQDVNFEKRTLTVAQQVERVGGPRVDGGHSTLEFAPPKTKGSRRTLPLPDSLAIALNAHHKRQSEDRLKAGPDWVDMGLVFGTGFGTPIEASRLTADFRRITIKAGLPAKRFHDCRHAVASALLSENTHPRLVMELLGHSKISMTLDTYSHVIEKSMRGVADTMDRLLTGSSEDLTATLTATGGGQARTRVDSKARKAQ